ncbi:ABC transporter permease [Halostagnicola sp. A-GB9-2]|uniref:ABC transporter permease n=1 Tax=Halostagnicola sp. A-GB9-2 TaxID=3048066 RepID=UPI0024C0DC24|nr:ABC transporter permease [Halostagnicola sp. A-GB9-2]MDJ1433807.1 ABC transporter permease [Halostagnicola sp. A-GB9-2]
MSILRYAIDRILQTIPVLIGVSLITFLFINALPGDVISALYADQALGEESIRALEERHGLNESFFERYLSFMAGILQGDLGYSIHYETSVTSLVLTRAGPTLMLTLSAFAFAIVTAIPLGAIAASRRNQSPDHLSRIVALFGVSTPSFWVGIMLIVIFAVTLGWLPSGGLVYPWRAPGHYGFDSQLELYVQTVQSLLLPMIALGTMQMAMLMRIERSEMVETLQRDYIQLARAYGVSERTILRKHAFREAQLPIITIVGLNISTALGGSVVIEQVFDINGIGKLLLSAIELRDFQVVTGITLVLAAIFVIGVVITDIAYAYIDPRITLDGGE